MEQRRAQCSWYVLPHQDYDFTPETVEELRCSEDMDRCAARMTGYGAERVLHLFFEEHDGALRLEAAWPAPPVESERSRWPDEGLPGSTDRSPQVSSSVSCSPRAAARLPTRAPHLRGTTLQPARATLLTIRASTKPPSPDAPRPQPSAPARFG